jgi:hypothetical protein
MGLEIGEVGEYKRSSDSELVYIKNYYLGARRTTRGVLRKWKAGTYFSDRLSQLVRLYNARVRAVNEELRKRDLDPTLPLILIAYRGEDIWSRLPPTWVFTDRRWSRMRAFQLSALPRSKTCAEVSFRCWITPSDWKRLCRVLLDQGWGYDNSIYLLIGPNDGFVRVCGDGSHT